VKKIDWLVNALNSLQERKASCSVANLGDKFVARSELTEGLVSCDNLGGGIGTAASKGFKNMGADHGMMRWLKEKARVVDLKVLEPSAFRRDKRAFHACEKVAFAQSGRRVLGRFFGDGEYRNEVVMTWL
jgi:hypothetical protein